MNCLSKNIVKSMPCLRNAHAVQGIVALRRVHTTTVTPNYVDAEALPIPNNIDAAETTRFSPQRSRDISANVILSQYGSMSSIDITTDNSAMGNNSSASQQDPHLQSYDCFGAVSLNSAMQSNVPSPFGGMNKFTHLNMPGGQWSQDYKFMSQNLHSSHYTTLRDQARANWVSYDQNATINKKDHHLPHLTPINIRSSMSVFTKRDYSTSKGEPSKSEPPKSEEPLTKQQQLKKAFKEYGSTIIIFHVAISLVSLGGFYALVSGGIDPMPILKLLGLEDQPAVTNKIVKGGSTFVVAYAIHKIFAPLRITITLGATPFIVKYLRSKGLLKMK